MAVGVGVGIAFGGKVWPRTPIALPTAVTPTAVWGIKQPGWGGNAYQINGTYNVGWAADNTPDATQMAAAFASAIGAGGVTSITCYDTTGNGNHLTQAVAANCMAFDSLNNFRGRPQINTADAQMGGVARYLNIPAMAGMDASNYAVFAVVDPLALTKTGNIFAFKNLANTYQVTLSSGSNITFGLSDLGTAGTVVSGICLRAQPCVIGLLSNPTARTFYARETTATLAALASAAITGGGCVGTQAITPTSNGFSGGIFCGAVYNLAGSAQNMTVAQGQAVYDALKSGYEVTTAANRQGVLIVEGDSIAYGYTAAAQVGQVKFAAAGLAGGRCEIFNVSQSGITMQTISAASPTKTETILSIVSGYAGPVAVMTQAGTNDIAAGRTAVNVETDQATYQGKVKAARPGVPVIYGAITPRNDGSWSAPKDVIAVAVNTYRAALTGGASAYIDYRALLHNQVQADASDPLYYNTLDLLHPTQLNHVNYLGPADRAALLPYLP